jgi:CRISPR-associated protein Csb2
VSYLLLTVRFLDERYHGLLDRGGPPEWPPSPFRLFQALVAGVARRGELVVGEDVPSNRNFTKIGKALSWLQKHTREHPPIIIAPKHKMGQAITRFVPNNDGDKKFDRQERLAAKPLIPTLFILEKDQKPEVHYVWDVSGASNCPEKEIRDAARALTSLGWGIDMAYADARLSSDSKVSELKGIRWYPKRNAGSFHNTLRTPTYDEEMQQCTLCDLRHCHSTFINRIEHGKPLKTVDKPKVFDRVLYTSAERPIGRPRAVFKLIDENEDLFRYPHAKLIHIAGMVRHLAIKAMDAGKGSPPPWIQNPAEWVSRVVRGKRDESVGDDHKQFSYVPLPSIGHAHSDAMIRNVMIVAPLGMERELNYLAERLDGQALELERNAGSCATESTPNLSQRVELQKFTPPRGKFIAKCYLGISGSDREPNGSTVWQTVTPVILDGCNRKSKSDKPDAVARATQKLICKALLRAGIEAPCEFTWQSIPFMKNTLSAHKYDREGRRTGYFRPAYLQGYTAVHVRIRFGRRAVSGDPESPWIPATAPGPIMIGSGRHCGFGLLAVADMR